MKKTANSTTPTPTIEELLQRLEMLEKQNAELEAKLKKQSALDTN
ncbi:hypothetical protein [Heyndrickxia sporothermodurans]